MTEIKKKRVPLPPRAQKIIFLVVGMIGFVSAGIYFSQRPSVPVVPVEMQTANLAQIGGDRKATDALNTQEMRDRVIKADNVSATANQAAGVTSVQPIEDRNGAGAAPGAVLGVSQSDTWEDVKQEQAAEKNPQVQVPVVIAPRPLSEQEMASLNENRRALRAKMESLAGKTKIYEASLMQNGNGHIPVVIPPSLAASGGNAAGTGADTDKPKPSIRAGDMVAGALSMHGDTEAPGIMRAVILSGDHAGVALLGTVSSNALGDKLSINFNRAAFKKKTMAISAIALTADASSQDVASFVDRKYLERFILSPMGAAAESIASTLTQTPTSTSVSVGGAVTQSNTGLNTGDVARIAAAKALQEVAKTSEASKKPVAYVEPTEKSNRLITIMFLDDVFLN